MTERQSTAMSDHVPIVIVKSEGSLSAKEIITNIRKVPIEEGQIQFGSSDLVGLKYNLVTKYYNVDILFIPYEKPLNTIPQPLQMFIEGVLIYFDAENRNILDTIKSHLEYLNANPIELVMLLCDKLFEEERLGMTYKEIKQSTRLMDIIELGRVKEKQTDDDDDADHHDPVGYDELLQVLQNFIWSNVDFKQVAGKSAAAGSGMSALLGDHDLDDEVVPEDGGAEIDASLDFNRLSLGNDEQEVPSSLGEEEDEEAIEAELAGFEKLLTELMMFKNTASSLTPNERFAYTQNFADAFDEIIGEDGTNSDEELPGT